MYKAHTQARQKITRHLIRHQQLSRRSPWLLKEEGCPRWEGGVGDVVVVHLDRTLPQVEEEAAGVVVRSDRVVVQQLNAHLYKPDTHCIRNLERQKKQGFLRYQRQHYPPSSRKGCVVNGQ